MVLKYKKQYSADRFMIICNRILKSDESLTLIAGDYLKYSMLCIQILLRKSILVDDYSFRYLLTTKIYI